MTEEQETMMRCYNAMGHGQGEDKRLESAKKLHEWLQTAPAPTKPE